GGYIVLPASLQTRVFEIDYLNLIRGGMSRTRVSSGQVTQSRSDRNAGENNNGLVGSEGGQQGSNDRRGGQTTGSVIDTVTNADFWAELQSTLGTILGGGE